MSPNCSNESHQAKTGASSSPNRKLISTRLRAWKEGVVKKLTGGLGQLSKQRTVQYIQGTRRV